ncbi:hypothetical protein C8R44DRAFT_907351 [Mycena epipterygia]|nr:hypothetical protein C8R44DRAFT_907351 [Mycena epipterygia]
MLPFFPRHDLIYRLVVIFDSHHFRLILEGEWTGGEGIWATSTLRALKNMGYSVLITGDIERTIQMYHIFHHFVVMVVSEPEKTTAFWAHDLVRSPTNPGGIPVWKLFEFQFWGQSINPLGPQWTLNPEDALVGRGYPQNTYLGYSIEAQCSKLPFIPHSKRNREIWVIAKTLVYFHPDLRAWAPDFFDLAANSTGVSFATGTGEPLGSQQKSFRVRESDVASSIANLGPLVQDDFSFLLSHSLVVVGMGDPMFSPTPYDALCLGVPLINPIKEAGQIVQWDRTNPSDRTRWRTQHDMLRHLSPPYVYHVFKGDREGFVQAIKDAIDHPIQRSVYVLERMTMSAVENRLGKILEHDWRAEAADVLRQRKESGNGRVSAVHFIGSIPS